VTALIDRVLIDIRLAKSLWTSICSFRLFNLVCQSSFLETPILDCSIDLHFVVTLFVIRFNTSFFQFTSVILFIISIQRFSLLNVVPISVIKLRNSFLYSIRLLIWLIEVHFDMLFYFPYSFFGLIYNMAILLLCDYLFLQDLSCQLIADRLFGLHIYFQRNSTLSFHWFLICFDLRFKISYFEWNYS